jgi:integrase
MASYRKVGARWRVDVCVNGARRGRTLATKREARAWAAAAEDELRRGDAAVQEARTLGDAMTRYALEVSPTKRGARKEVQYLARLKADRIAGVALRQLAPADLADWRDRRLMAVSGSSVRREMIIVSHVLTVARKEWGWMVSAPMRDVRRPKDNPPRQRVPTEEESTRILDALGYAADEPPYTKSARVGWAWLFALETAMRAGEIVSLAWVEVFDRHVHIPKPKNGHARDVPLSPAATVLLRQIKPLAHADGGVLGVSSTSMDSLWRRAAAAAGVEGLHFHDSRRAALTRLARVFSVMELARISGHRDLRILQNVYYAPDVGSLADKMV